MQTNMAKFYKSNYDLLIQGKDPVFGPDEMYVITCSKHSKESESYVSAWK